MSSISFSQRVTSLEMSVPVPAPVSGGLLTADALEAPTAPRETNQANLVPRRIMFVLIFFLSFQMSQSVNGFFSFFLQ
jgi:hypothetical protein